LCKIITMRHFLFTIEDGKYQFEKEVDSDEKGENFHFMATPAFDGIYQEGNEILIAANSKIEAVRKLP